MKHTICTLALALAMGIDVTEADACTDADGDGHCSIETGGIDCADRDPNRYPGNPEICDADDHDEDCDYGTFGFRDVDGDGRGDHRCCNRTGPAGHPKTRYTCGDDCDDFQVAIVPGAQVCDFSDPKLKRILICRGGHEPWEGELCAEPMTCAPQPNHTGVCR
jgi:hypothetical protein